MVKKIYCYHDGERIVLSHDVPETGINYVEKVISIIGVPQLRAVSIKNSSGQLLYNNIEHIPLENNVMEAYLTMGVDTCDKDSN
jgi:hypothetical protein